MDKTILLFGIGGIVLLLGAFLLIPANAGREMSIPPTKAFSKIIIGGKTITAKDYSSIANLTGMAGNVTGKGSVSCSLVSGKFECKLKPITCPTLQGVKGVDSNGNLFCSVL